MRPLAPAVLTTPEVLVAWRSASLPARWRMVVVGGGLRPLLAPGAVVDVERGGAARGKLVCVAAGPRLAWRRVLAMRGGEAFLRAERAPFADGWSGEVVGTAAIAGPIASIAEAMPAPWTAVGWLADTLLQRARAVPGSLRVRVRRRQRFLVRPLAPGDAEAFRRFYAPAWTGREETHAPADAELVTLGLFTPGGALVGSTSLRPLGEGASLSCNTVVASRLRGAGGGEALLAAALDLARRRGDARVVGRVRPGNRASLAACRAVGFKRTGRWVSDPGDRFAATETPLVELVAEL